MLSRSLGLIFCATTPMPLSKPLLTYRRFHANCGLEEARWPSAHRTDSRTSSTRFAPARRSLISPSASRPVGSLRIRISTMRSCPLWTLSICSQWISGGPVIRTCSARIRRSGISRPLLRQLGGLLHSKIERDNNFG